MPKQPTPNRQHSHPEHNASMSERDKQKTVANPSPGSSDPGNEGQQGRRASDRDSGHRH